MSYVYIFLTIIFTVYGQIVIKWQVLKVNEVPSEPLQKIAFLCQLLMNPWIITGFMAAFLAAIAWMLAIAKLPLSYAYPFVSLSFVFVSGLSALFFKETLSIYTIMGLALIVLGIVVMGQNS